MIATIKQHIASLFNTRQGKYFALASGFLFLISLTLWLAPTAQAKTFSTSLNWIHWIGFFVWLGSFGFLLLYTENHGIKTNSLLIPLAALISGWGLLTIWRLSTTLGAKQTVWLAISVAAVSAGLRYQRQVLQILRNHKYLWLFAGLAITTLTLIFGTNPNGAGPNLWLGCCGIYLQPSEPLKLLLILYLAAYFADRQPFTTKLLPTIAPTLVMAGMALLILVVQKDLGTASIIIFIYASMIYIATGKKRLLLISLLVIVLAALLGYYLFDVVQLRFEAWINPWLDPSGRSYQIVQSLISIAAGGMTGRGPGMGYPNLVPIAFSDFIFSAIGEEYGLPGALALLIAIMLFTFQGYRIGLKANNRYHRYLSIGLATYIASQSILIIGGNIRLLPLTGVTLPFFSYGGSSLLTTFIALMLIAAINHQEQENTTLKVSPTPIFHMAGMLLVGFFAVGILTSWWSIWRGPDLLTRTDNARRTISDRFIQRGTIYDRNDNPISFTEGTSGSYIRRYPFPELSPLNGYTQPFFGQAGLESSLDDILRGLENQSSWRLWLSHLLYGQSPEGLDVSLTIDAALQQYTAELLPNTAGAVVLLDAKTGELLVLYSSPFYDASLLIENWDTLNEDPQSPLLNRATQSLYPPGPALAPFVAAYSGVSGELPEVISELSSPLESNKLTCTKTIPLPATWGEVIQAGCPGPLEFIGNSLGDEGLQTLFEDLGFYDTPAIRAELAQAISPSSITTPAVTAFGQADMLVSPLQMALAAAIFSNQGVRPTPQLVLAAENYQGDWLNYTDPVNGTDVFSATQANQTASMLSTDQNLFWETTATAFTETGTQLTWYLAGSLPDAENSFTVAVLIERFEPEFAARIGQGVLQEALSIESKETP